MHAIYMNRALTLASLGIRHTSPNPLVGCVIVKDGRIIGEGWHKKYGHSHAEIEALNDAERHGENVQGASVYVTLEPCSHYGKTPPCVNRLVSEGISEVIFAMKDPNPKVNGKGIEILSSAGIKVHDLGAEFERKAKFLNRGFIFVHKYNRPFIHVKAAMSLDGKLCLANNSSKWLTGIISRTKAHEIRAENDAVLVGVNTILNDNPELTVRHVKGENPLRIILDTKLMTPTDSKVITSPGKCLILTGYNAGYDKSLKLEEAGAEILRLPYDSNGHISLNEAVKYLAGRGILNLMVEGGAEVISAFLRLELADYMSIFFSPRIFGEGKGININAGFNSVNDAFRVDDMRVKKMGNDILVEGRLTCSPAL